MIELLGVQGISATLEGGLLVVVGAQEAAERQALLDLVTARALPARGRLSVDNVALTARTAARVRAAVAHVDPGEDLASQRSVLRNAMARRASPGGLGRLLILPRRREREAATTALTLVGLGDRVHEPAYGLTRPERVRVLLARALARRARHVVVRELDRALPPHDTLAILVLLRSLTRRDRRIVLVSLAEPSLASSLADRFLPLSEPTVGPDRRVTLVKS